MGVATGEPLPESAEVVIVGAGIMGVSIAFHLGEAGITDVLLLDAGDAGSGSSGKPIGGVRAQFSDPINVELGRRSLEAFRRFPERPGADIRLDEVGYLFLLTTDEDVGIFDNSVAMQRELGVASRMVTPREAAELNPYLDPRSIVAAAYSPTDGHARPGLAVRGYLDAAQRLGVRFGAGFRVTGIERNGDAITAVRTVAGDVRTDTVVCAAGAWSREIGTYAGVDLPVTPMRRQLAFTAPIQTAPRIPFTLDFATTAYFHNSDDRLLFGLADPSEQAGFDRTWTPAWLDLFGDFARRHAPGLTGMPIESGWAGLYELTPDHNALIGEASGVQRFLYATGFSGHGFLQAPAVGEVVRDLVLGREPVIDIAPLSADRFTDTEAGLRLEVNVI
jgi:sarcosine oxidase, subunit beta